MPLSVLIVDDNPEILRLYTEAIPPMSQDTIAVRTATDGVDALEKIVASRPDCAVIDVKMPALNGTQLVLALRGDPQTQDIPLVILTAMAQDKDRFAGMASGADQYLIKPVLPLELIEAIRAAIQISGEEREHAYRRLAESGEGS